MDGAGAVVGAFGRVEFRGVVLEELVIEAQGFSGVEGGFRGVVVAIAADVLEEFVDGVVVLEHGVVFLARADEVGEGELLGGEVELEGVGEGDFEGVVLAAGAAFEEVLAFFCGDEELGRAAGTAGILLDGLNGADVESLTHHDGEFFGGEFFAVAHVEMTISDRGRRGNRRRCGGEGRAGF